MYKILLPTNQHNILKLLQLSITNTSIFFSYIHILKILQLTDIKILLTNIV